MDKSELKTLVITSAIATVASTMASTLLSYLMDRLVPQRSDPPTVIVVPYPGGAQPVAAQQMLAQEPPGMAGYGAYHVFPDRIPSMRVWTRR